MRGVPMRGVPMRGVPVDACVQHVCDVCDERLVPSSVVPFSAAPTAL